MRFYGLQNISMVYIYSIKCTHTSSHTSPKHDASGKRKGKHERFAHGHGSKRIRRLRQRRRRPNIRTHHQQAAEAASARFAWSRMRTSPLKHSIEYSHIVVHMYRLWNGTRSERPRQRHGRIATQLYNHTKPERRVFCKYLNGFSVDVLKY